MKVFNYSFFSFFRKNANGGLLLIISAILAIIIANSEYTLLYSNLLDYTLSFYVGDTNILSHHGNPFTIKTMINECLMVIFFFHVGLEIKREVLVGELSSIRKAMLPVIAAIGGVITPVGIYLLFNHDALSIRGAAIPMATDIAFALGILCLLGKRVPLSLKIFLTAFAIVDDIGGILVIAFLYTSSLDVSSLFIGISLFVGLLIINKIGIYAKTIYILVGVLIWYFFLQSGVHSTIAGVLVALAIPAYPRLDIKKYIDRMKKSIQSFPYTDNKDIVLTHEQTSELKNIEAASDRVISPLQYMEDKLGGFVNYIILPLFAFANAGIVLSDNWHELLGVVTFGVAIGLFVGKLIGISLFTWLSVKLNITTLPEDIKWEYILGVACLGGVGFTVAIFMANLSFGDSSSIYLNQAKFGIIVGSILSGVVGYILLNKALPKKTATTK